MMLVSSLTLGLILGGLGVAGALTTAVYDSYLRLKKTHTTRLSKSEAASFSGNFSKWMSAEPKFQALARYAQEKLMDGPARSQAASIIQVERFAEDSAENAHSADHTNASASRESVKARVGTLQQLEALVIKRLDEEETARRIEADPAAQRERLDAVLVERI